MNEGSMSFNRPCWPQAVTFLSIVELNCSNVLHGFCVCKFQRTVSRLFLQYFLQSFPIFLTIFEDYKMANSMKRNATSTPNAVDLVEVE